MRMHISPGSELPIYRQIMRQITDAIAGGRLRPGDKLTSHRELAKQLVVAPLTVKKAYDELEQDGMIRTERGRGTFVASDASRVDPDERRGRLREAVRTLLSRAYLSGIPLGEVEDLLREVHGELEGERNARKDEEQP